MEGSLYLINDNNVNKALHKQAFPEEEKKVKPMFLMFMNRDNEETWKHSKEWV